MPIAIRTLARRPTINAASYRFPNQQIYDEHIKEWPWLRMPSNMDRLCNICSRLDFAWLFSQSLFGCTVSDGESSAQMSDGICLGLYTEILHRTSCEFCQLLVYALEEGADIEMLNDRKNWPRKEIWILNYFLGQSTWGLSPATDNGSQVVRLGVRLKAEDEQNVIVSFNRRTVMIQQIRDDKDQLANSGRIVDMDPEGLVQTVRQWLSRCHDDGNLADEAAKQADTKVRLIDTSEACIVGPFSNERYVALSYTWGKIDPLVLLKENDAELRKQGALLRHASRLPQTIQDAIKLCRLLGERYLWVDSMCIQQDTTDKHDQIQQMDRIYQNAALCIVAAAGSHANVGLPGLSCRDVRQHIIEIDNLRLANTVPDLTQSIAQTFWETRGWCFQESLLSSRKLIFTPNQTYYHCQHGDCSEDTYSSIHETYELAVGGMPLRISREKQANWDIYHHIVVEYSKRYLSFEDDVLNAFAGISAYLSKMVFFDSPLVMGIPICSLEVGLLWHPATRLRRRDHAQFPSWSWAGWLGHVEYPGTAVHEKVFDRTIGCMQWDFGSSATETRSWITGMPPRSWDGWHDWKRSVAGELNDVWYTHMDSGPGLWFSHPIAQQNWPVQPPNSFLKCTAEVATLKLTGEHTEFWLDNEICEGGHEVCHLQVFDQNDVRIGMVVMDGQTFEEMSFPQTSFSFIKVSQTTLTDQNDPAWNTETKAFSGRPGEPAINIDAVYEPFEVEFDQDVHDVNICWCIYNVLVVNFQGETARRLAVGRVYFSAFDDAGPENKTFMLG